MRIETKDRSGVPNGYLVPLWNSLEQEWRPDQVYLTVVSPGRSKGPHLHRKRCGRFVCIRGNVLIITRDGFHRYKACWTGEDHGHRLIEVPPGTAAELVNIASVPAFVLNMPTPAWSAADPDEWPVENWSPDVKYDLREASLAFHPHSEDGRLIDHLFVDGCLG